MTITNTYEKSLNLHRACLQIDFEAKSKRAALDATKTVAMCISEIMAAQVYQERQRNCRMAAEALGRLTIVLRNAQALRPELIDLINQIEVEISAPSTLSKQIAG